MSFFTQLAKMVLLKSSMLKRKHSHIQFLISIRSLSRIFYGDRKTIISKLVIYSLQPMLKEKYRIGI